MKKRNILILILVLLLTGCTPEYNLEIKSGSINEKLIISEIPNNYTSNDFKIMMALPEDKEFYNITFNNNIATYQYTYKFDDFSKSNMINSCYNAFRFYDEEDYFVFQTGSEFTCYPYQINDSIFAKYNELNIKIKLEGYKVIKNNADSVEKNTYKWTINKNNYNNKPIFLKFKKNKISKNDQIEKSEENQFIILIITGIVFVIGILMLIYVLNLNKKINKL